jgi:hypothetical protein
MSLTVLVDRPVQVGPAAHDLDVRFVDEAPITGRVACRTRGADELRREGLHPPIHRHVINLDAAHGQQLLHVAAGQPVAQIPAHCHRDHPSREAVAGRSRRAKPRIDHPISLLTQGQPSQRNRPPQPQASLGSSRAASLSSAGSRQVARADELGEYSLSWCAIRGIPQWLFNSVATMDRRRRAVPVCPALSPRLSYASCAACYLRSFRQR